MNEQCPECGAPIPEGGSCRDHFHSLLLLEGEIAGVPGSILHFYVVATYGLQHPESMNYTAEALTGLRAAVTDALDENATMDEIRLRARNGAKKLGRITRRAGEDPVPWLRGKWPVTIADVCTADTFGNYDTYEDFADRVLRWARSVRETLDSRLE